MTGLGEYNTSVLLFKMDTIILLFCFAIPLAVSGQQAGAVENLTVREEYGALKISWDPPSYSLVDYYSIEYRTTGSWISLVERTTSTFFHWYDFEYYSPRPGMTYHIRVVVHHGNDPTKAATVTYFPTKKHDRHRYEQVLASGSKGQHFFNLGTAILSLIAAKLLM